MTQFVVTLTETLHVSVITDALYRALKKISKFINAIVNNIQYTRKVNETIKELSQLTDKELADIGLSRGMIRSVAMEAYK